MRVGWLAISIAIGLVAGAAVAQATKPRVPPGRHPGGVPVAIIGPGVEYTDAAIASRLARDGEGEIVGWDFVDNDRRPWQRCAVENEHQPSCAALAVRAVLGEAEGSCLVVVRVAADRPQSLVDAVKLTASGPARIVLIAPDGLAPPPALLAEAAARFPQLLFIVPAPISGPATKSPNVLSVVAATITHSSVEPAAAAPADLAVSVQLVATALPESYRRRSDIAAARTAAMAARLSAAVPGLDAATLKRRILEQATALTSNRR